MPELTPVFSLPDARDQILEVALAAFAERGFHGATMRDIAARAEVSQSLVQYHFKGKEALWNMVGERTTADFLDYMASETAPDVPPEEGPGRVLRRYLAYWKERPLAFRFNLWRMLEGPSEERRQRSRELNSRAVPVFQQAQAAGVIRDDLPAGLTMIMAAAVIQFWLHSKTEVSEALAAGGEALPDDEAFLASLLTLIEAPSDAKPQKGQTR